MPGLNPARPGGHPTGPSHEGYKVIGFKRGWAGLTDLVRDKEADNSGITALDRGIRSESRPDRRHVPSHSPPAEPCPPCGRSGAAADIYTETTNDLTPKF